MIWKLGRNWRGRRGSPLPQEDMIMVNLIVLVVNLIVLVVTLIVLVVNL